MKKELNVLIFLFFLLIVVNYSFLENLIVKAFDETEKGVIERVVDGDTVVIDGVYVRLLGINSPEKGERGYFESKEFLEDFTGKEVSLIYGKEKYDKYRRKLAYLFYSGRNLNLESLRNGYSNPYFPKGKDKLYSEFFRAWGDCLERGKGLCESEKEECLEFSWKPKEDYVSIKNICNYNFDLEGYSIKDEGRKKYAFFERVLIPQEEIILTSIDWEKDYVWTKSGDSIFIRNNEEKLIYFEYY